MQAEFLVTGGAGFIGSNIVRPLVQAGRSVRVLDNLATGRSANFDGVLDRIDFRPGDVRDLAGLTAAAGGVRCLLHLAALPSVVASVEDPAGTHAVNLTGTLNALIAARDARVERVVFSSSSAIYGNRPELPKRETMEPAPLSPYAVHKLAGEYYGRLFHDLYGVRAFSLRYFNVFGPRQNPASQYAAVIPRFVEALLQGRPPVIYGDGRQTRDFVFVDDVVRANLRCCEAPEGAAGTVCNIAAGQRISITELARTLMRLMGVAGEPAHEPARPGEVLDSQADIGRARDVLGWTPQVDLETGLRQTIAWFREALGKAP